MGGWRSREVRLDRVAGSELRGNLPGAQGRLLGRGGCSAKTPRSGCLVQEPQSCVVGAAGTKAYTRGGGGGRHMARGLVHSLGFLSEQKGANEGLCVGKG